MEKHLDEQLLNMYLDGELDAAAIQAVQSHLDTCEACRAEVAAMQELFAALEELAPVPHLAPGVLERIEPAQRGLEQLPRRRWLIPALQAAAALALLAWIGVHLAQYGTWLADLPLIQQIRSWSESPVLPWMPDLSWPAFVQWITTRWDAFSTWIGTVWSDIQAWPVRLSNLGDAQVSMVWLIVLGVTLAGLWVFGNAVLLRRFILNGNIVQMKRRF
jgi:predicted anti-sigma-YlaC factor YlaD